MTVVANDELAQSYMAQENTGRFRRKSRMEREATLVSVTRVTCARPASPAATCRDALRIRAEELVQQHVEQALHRGLRGHLQLAADRQRADAVGAAPQRGGDLVHRLAGAHHARIPQVARDQREYRGRVA